MTALPSRPAQVLGLLLEAAGTRSGQEMGQRLGCTRAAVGKAVSALREMGFEIEASPKRGYRLVAEPDRVLPARVEARLAPGGLGLPLVHFDRIDSTNLEARRRAEAGAPHGTCVVAEAQEAGRGRLDRRWDSPTGSGLLFSLLLRPAMPLAKVFSLNNLVSLAVCAAIEARSDLEPRIKWPNDVFLEGGKLAGILTELAARADSIEHVVVGVGINVNQAPQVADRRLGPAVSLAQASGRTWDRAELLAGILDELGRLYPEAAAGAWHRLGLEYNRRSLLTGRRVTVREGEQVRQGLARGVAPDGALLLEEDGAGIVSIHHGDVSILALEDGPSH